MAYGDYMSGNKHRSHRGRRSTLWLLVGAASGRPGTARSGGALRYGGDAAFPPFESLDAHGKPRGFQVDLIGELGRVMKSEIVVSLKPWAQTEADFRLGRLDMVAMVDTAERRRWVLFAQGHATPALAIYRRQERPDLQDLQGIVDLRIAVLEGNAMRDTLKTWLSNVRGPFTFFPDAGGALAAVQQGQADIALLPRAYADPVIAMGGASGVVAAGLSLRLQSYAFAVAPGNEALRERLQRGLDELERSGRLEALRVRWLSSHRDVAERGLLAGGLARQREWTWNVGGASAVALLLMGGVVWRHGRRVVAERQRRQSAEIALSRAEELLGRTFTHNPEPMLIVESGSGLVSDANEALLSLLGVPAKVLMGQPLGMRAQHINAVTLGPLVASLDGEDSLEAAPMRLTRADGRERDCLISAERLRIGDAVHVFCIVRDITEQLARDNALRSGFDAMAAELAQSQRELEMERQSKVRAEGALRDFTRAIAHDMKTPLNAVQGFAGLLHERLRAGHVEEAMDYSKHIDRAAQRMNAMISALSRLAHVAQQPLRRQPVDMARLAHGIWALLSVSQSARCVQFGIDELPIALADPDLAAQVWQNLLGNAWKYTGQVNEAKVRVDSYCDHRGTWYRVTDNGAGFDMANAKLLFQPFQRMHAASQFAGSGVGLSLVRRIVDHHGGDVRLRSSPGVGTVAEFTLEPQPTSQD
jgi:PAS domain S-box-containing protein